MAISASMVKELREMTGAGMMDCKKALTETDGDMDAACSKALEQIEEKEYVAKLKQDGMRNFIKYGIACFKKDCKVVMGNNITK